MVDNFHDLSFINAIDRLTALIMVNQNNTATGLTRNIRARNDSDAVSFGIKNNRFAQFAPHQISNSIFK